MNTSRNQVEKEVKKEYRLERRTFMKWSAVAGLAGMIMDFDQAVAAGECATNLPDSFSAMVNASLDKASTENRAGDFFYWFDGPMIPSLVSTSGFVRGRLALFLDAKLGTAGDYLETVILADESKNILEERRYTAAATTSTKTGKPPYVVFDNLQLKLNTKYVVYFVIASSSDASKLTVYSYTIVAEDVRLSRFDYKHLSANARQRIPTIFINDMQTAGHGIKEEAANFGIITTPYQDFAGLPTHTVRARFAKITQEGSFEVYVEPMHGDVDAGHYMRYFAVVDPVGRFLSVKKRIHGSGETPSGSGLSGYYKLSPGYIASTNDGGANHSWKDYTSYMASAQINILDCPYVSVVCEDIRDAIARVSIRLR